MRISSNTFFELGVNSINSQLSGLVKTQQQISSGRRILTPSDDPVASSAVVETSQSLNVTTQHLENIVSARSTLNFEESVTASINRVYQQARQTIISAGNPTLNSADRATLATTLRSNYDELLSLANSRDGQGNYLFSGFATNTPPFSQTTGPAVYAGDQGQRKLQITPSRQIDISDSGQALFKPGVNGSDPFAIIENFITALGSGTPNSQVTTSVGTANTGTAGITTSVSNPATLPQSSVTLTYTTTPAAAFTTVSADPAWNGLTFLYTSGAPNTVNGVTFTISGAPNVADAFTIANASDTALLGLDAAQNNTLRIQTTIGSRLNELDSTEVTGQDASLQYQTTLSNLRDVDFTRAISDLTRQQTGLEAAQKSFISIQNLNLFKLL